MVAIKGMKEMPKDCKKCPLMGTDGTPTDYFKPMMCVAIWATKHEIKHCIGGKILDDCPLVEIEERKVGKWVMPDKYYNKKIWRKCSACNTHFEKYHKYVTFSGEVTYSEEIANYCKACGAEMKGAEE